MVFPAREKPDRAKSDPKWSRCREKARPPREKASGGGGGGARSANDDGRNVEAVVGKANSPEEIARPASHWKGEAMVSHVRSARGGDVWFLFRFRCFPSLDDERTFFFAVAGVWWRRGDSASHFLPPPSPCYTPLFLQWENRPTEVWGKTRKRRSHTSLLCGQSYAVHGK